MKIASHNSWTYLSPKKWYMKPFAKIGRCQEVDIKTQYEKYNAKLFDLRIRFVDHEPIVVHSAMVYKYTFNDLIKDFNYLNDKDNIFIRIILDLRSYKGSVASQVADYDNFYTWCSRVYNNITFCGGRILPSWSKVLKECPDIDTEIQEKHASVCSPKYIDDWYPKHYAKHNNKKNKEQYFNEGLFAKEYLMIDFVNI